MKCLQGNFVNCCNRPRLWVVMPVSASPAFTLTASLAPRRHNNLKGCEGDWIWAHKQGKHQSKLSHAALWCVQTKQQADFSCIQIIGYRYNKPPPSPTVYINTYKAFTKTLSNLRFSILLWATTYNTKVMVIEWLGHWFVSQSDWTLESDRVFLFSLFLRSPKIHPFKLIEDSKTVPRCECEREWCVCQHIQCVSCLGPVQHH